MMPQSPTSLQTFQTCPRQYEAKYITKEVVFQSNEHAVFGDVIHKNLEAYLKGEGVLDPFLCKLKPILDRMKPFIKGVELKLAVDNHLQPTDFNSPDAYQRCIIDALLMSEDGKTAVCVDWKTGKKSSAQMQKDIIKRCVGATYPQVEKIVTIFSYFIKGGIDVQSFKPNDPLTELDDLMAELVTCHAINTFPPRPNGLCKKWCDVTNCRFNGRNQ